MPEVANEWPLLQVSADLFSPHGEIGLTDLMALKMAVSHSDNFVATFCCGIISCACETRENDGM